jgi:hypothetical protein
VPGRDSTDCDGNEVLPCFCPKRKSAESFFILLLATILFSISAKGSLSADFEFTSNQLWLRDNLLRFHLHRGGRFFLLQQFLKQAIIRRHTIPVARSPGWLYRLGRRRRNQVNILTTLASRFFAGIFIGDLILMAALRALESYHFLLPFSLKNPSVAYFLFSYSRLSIYKCRISAEVALNFFIFLNFTGFEPILTFFTAIRYAN